MLRKEVIPYEKDEVQLEPVQEGQTRQAQTGESRQQSVQRLQGAHPLQEKRQILIAFFFAFGPGLVGVIWAGLADLYLWGLPAGARELASMLFRYGGTWLAVLLYVVLVERRPLASIGLQPMTEVWLLRLVAIISFLGGLMGWGPAYILIGRIIQAGAEEVLCRGWLLSRMTGRYGLNVALAANSLLFVLMHAVNPGFSPLTVVTLTLFSLLMTLIVHQTKNVWWAIGIHAVWNWSISIIQ